ncbi:hypothetical protein CYMTET_24299 [Cymbomonas tetramitiformis]|uniref:Uncharacterized protein n=1 Tax=Cymbomonas tetramitiformis TaxID=36881 RepID=A0AAE0L0D3_9CHLO|nr:hypothetical protein CYMTET_24299 [Cymbomonas tetramitiformis]
MDFLENSTALRNTPYRASTRGVLSDALTKTFDYADNVIDILKARGYQPKASGVTLEGSGAREDFLALRSAMIAVLDSVNSVETAKIFDLELAYVSYHYDVNYMVFTMLSVLLRGGALAIYHTAAKRYPFDGRALLLRLHFEVEGIHRSDKGAYMESMRSLRVDEREDPQHVIDKFRNLADKHRQYHTDFSDSAHVETFLVVLEKSADESPYERDGVSRLARFPTPSVPDSGGAGLSKSGGAKAYSFRPKTVHPAVGDWASGPGPYRNWQGQGHPCLVCFRMWGLTDVHEASKGLCPYVCKAAFSDGRALPSACDPPPRPDPQHRAPAAAANPQQPASAFTFQLPHDLAAALPDPLDQPAEVEPLDSLSTDDDEPFNPSLAVIAGYDEIDEDDEDWPAFAESPVWIPGLTR